MVELQRQCRSFHDMDSVHQWFSDNFPARRFRGGSDATFHMRVVMARADRFSFIDSSWSSPGAATGGSADLTVVAGQGRGYRLSHGRAEIDPSLPLLAPAEGLSAEWEERRTSVVVLELAGVERIARAATGNQALQLRRTGLTPTSPELVTYWSTLLGSVREHLDASSDLLESPLIANSTFHHLATAFLHAFPTNWLDATDERSGGSAVVRRAVEYMHAHAGDPITITDVACAAYISTRGLHFAFTKELGESPGQVLRRIRLDGAHADLLAAGPETTVAMVARRWGFAHLQRFADAYQRAYGEKPSESLRRWGSHRLTIS